MGKTRRRDPVGQETRKQKLEREWERKLRAEKSSSEPELERDPISVLPRDVESVRREAEAIVNRRLGADLVRARATRAPFSVQSPGTDIASESGGGLIWWTGSTLDTYIPLSEYGDRKRLLDIRAFALISPMILNATSVLSKKVQSLQWTIEGGRNLAQKWQKILNNFENGDGWDYFIARWIRAYCESDQPAYAEIIRDAPAWATDDNWQLTPRGERAIERGDDAVWPIVDARVMDPINCYPTSSTEYPLIYHNPYTGKRYQLRPYQFMSLIDMPGVDDRYPQSAVCAVTRAVWAAQEERMAIRYAMEKMSENPGAGIVTVNASNSALRTAIEGAKTEREARGVVYYKGMIFIPTLSPEGGAKMEFLNFSDLPANFSRSELYSITKEIVATSFGLDILELGSISGRLGTATQAKVAAAKGRTKSIGAIMQGVERAFRYKLLPDSVSFNIKKYDQDEELLRAEIDEKYFNNAIRMAQFTPPDVVLQYLADKKAIPNEYPFVGQDLTLSEEVVDVAPPSEDTTSEGSSQAAQAEASGPVGTTDEGPVKSRSNYRIRIDRNGEITVTEPSYRIKAFQSKRPFVPAPVGGYP